MRKYQKKLLIDLIQTIYEAHATIKEYIANGKYEEVKLLLGDCQDTAIQMGETVELSEGVGVKTVKYLEDYCDLLFQVYESISHNISGNISYNLLNEKLTVVEQSISEDIKVHYEVVFMPYKASMWDSMESVYLAAANDPRCEVYCMPIPYFDKNADGTLGTMQYEGELFPKDIKITNWKIYNVEERHPDIIFLQNPYDNDNYITTVHPAFYTKKLSSNTDCLAYLEYGIPLWIYKEPTPYERMIAGWFNFDLFFTYSKEYAKNQEYAMKLKKKDLHTKFLPLGSPKFDKIQTTKKSDFKLPDQWNKIISNKKVVLFNTSIGSLLDNTESYLQRLEEVLQIFKNNEDIALWWRPHPLSSATMQSMRKDLIDEYRKIVEDYRNEGWGIYDDSIDVHRAIAYSDAYYGDESSIVYLYCGTGKPFTICGKPHQCYSFTENQDTFEATLRWRMEHMRNGKGGNDEGYNNCMAWYLFYEDLDYKRFLELFLHYVIHKSQYQLSTEYELLQMKIYKDFVVNFDGTAGKKIYSYCKKNILEK